MIEIIVIETKELSCNQGIVLQPRNCLGCNRGDDSLFLLEGRIFREKI